MEKKKKLGLVVLLLLVGLACIMLFALNTLTYTPTSQALQAATTHSNYSVHETQDVVYFEPAETSSSTAIIFYQGAFVEEKSYGLWAAKLADAGYPVYLIHHPLNLAVMKPNKAQQIIEDYNITSYVIGGHSLGGVMASRFAHDSLKKQSMDQKILKGVFFLASYPDKKGSLEDRSLPVLSITGTNDGVLDQQAFQNNKQFLPKDTDYITIQGGNHAGFGSYGKQKGDNAAAITNKQQQEAVFTALQHWLVSFLE